MSSSLFVAERQGSGLKVNLLVNYRLEWDLKTAFESGQERIIEGLASSQVSRIDMVIRWGGCRRLSGFLPVQSVYSDFYVVDDYWPSRLWADKSDCKNCAREAAARG